MKSLHKPNVKARSQIEFLQIIDQPPDSYSTVYTTLIECLKTASAKPMVITFDLPLWLKASRIVLEKGMPVIVRLGGFHTLKSFLGCVGYIMADSGLEDLMRLVYPGDVTHIMDGESYYKALRAHFLIDCALCCYLFEDKIAEEDLEDMASYIAKCSNEKLGVNHKTRVVQELLERIKKKFEIMLSSNSRTAALWTTYVSFLCLTNIIDLCKRCIFQLKVCFICKVLVTKIDNNGANVWSTKIGDAHKTANKKSYSIGFAIDQVHNIR